MFLKALAWQSKKLVHQCIKSLVLMSKVNTYHRNISFSSIFNELANGVFDVTMNVHLNHYIQISILSFGFIQCAFQFFASNWPFNPTKNFLTFDAKSRYLYK
jgi:hypothetical protein